MMCLFFASLMLQNASAWVTLPGVKHYCQYCPVAHTLEVIGERWSLLIVRDLMGGPKRYTDLASGLPGIGTNILANRLKDLEAAGILRKYKLPPPAASQVYELTEYGRELKSVLFEMARWGARSLGPPKPEDLHPGWLENALRTVGYAAPECSGAFVFRVGDEVASLADGEAQAGALEDPDAVVETDPEGFYYFFVDRDLSRSAISGDRGAVENLLGTLPAVQPLAA
jgi:DNA-binding HxlR family transcriptional regulator